MNNPIELTIASPILTFDVGGPGPYRLARHDARNLVLQRRNPKIQWVTVAFCGNNPRSIARVVSELATAHWSPAEGDRSLGDQVADLCRAIEALTAAIETASNITLKTTNLTPHARAREGATL